MANDNSPYRFVPKTQAQSDVMQITAPNVLVNGMWGSGKTHALAAKPLAMGILYPGNCIALVRKKRVDLEATLWKWFVDKILANIPQEWIIRHNDANLYRKLLNGTEFFGVGLDSTEDVNKLASREYGLIVVEEAREITEEDFDVKLVRCMRLPAVPFHQIVMATNPDGPAHWLYKRFYLEKPAGYDVIEATLLPGLPPGYYERLKQLRGIYYDRYVLGKWVSAEGLVYPFDPGKHILDGFTINPDWRRVLSIDFGFDHPFVAQWWAVSPSDVWFMYREIYHTHRTVKVHAQQILQYIAEDGVEIVATCDHDAEGMATLRENGIKTRKAQKDRLAGQQAVYEKFENDQIYYLRNARVELDVRLEMERKPTRTVEEFGGYKWMNKGKEDMSKKDDDGMDSTRYAIYTDQKSSELSHTIGRY